MFASPLPLAIAHVPIELAVLAAATTHVVLVHVAAFLARALIVGLPCQSDGVFERDALLQRLVVGRLQQVVRQLS